MRRPTRQQLRIVWTTLCLVACVSMLALWRRSYTWADTATIGRRQSFAIESIDGLLRFSKPSAPPTQAVTFSKQRPEIIRERDDGTISVSVFKWPFIAGRDQAWPVLPHWFVATTLACLAAVPWLRRRFSLQSLLIATTLVACVLAAIVATR